MRVQAGKQGHMMFNARSDNLLRASPLSHDPDLSLSRFFYESALPPSYPDFPAPHLPPAISHKLVFPSNHSHSLAVATKDPPPG